jgi:phosphoglycerate dehydrogenase-like enzyme
MPPSTVVVTEPEFRRAEQHFASTAHWTFVPAPPAEAELSAAIRQRGARHAVLGPAVYSGPLYDALPRGGVLARFGVGHDGLDKARATEAGLLCTNTPGVLHQSVAELTLLLMLAAARHLTGLAGAMQEGAWAPKPGVELQGKTLTIVGCGTIGRAVARIASAGFGMRTIGVRRAHGPAAAAAGQDFDATTDDYAGAVRDADYVSLHIPALPENVHFIGRERLSLLPERAWLINTARGAVIDEAALFDAVSNRRIAGAALDVYAVEPYEPISRDRDLRRLPGVILLPHVGSNTADANRGMAERAINNIRLAEAGDFGAMDLLNPEVLRSEDRTGDQEIRRSGDQEKT